MDTTFNDITDQGRGGLGTLLFFSTGNGSSSGFWSLRPFAAHPRNFGIGAVTDGDVKAGYSNWGDGVDLCAPSSGGANGITTTTLVGGGTLPAIPAEGSTTSPASVERLRRRPWPPASQPCCYPWIRRSPVTKPVRS